MANVVFSPQEDQLILAASQVPDALMEDFLDYEIALRRNHFKDEEEEAGFYFTFIPVADSSDEASGPLTHVFVSDEEIVKEQNRALVEDYSRQEAKDQDVQAQALYHAVIAILRSKAEEAGISDEE